MTMPAPSAEDVQVGAPKDPIRWGHGPDSRTAARMSRIRSVWRVTNRRVAPHRSLSVKAGVALGLEYGTRRISSTSSRLMISTRRHLISATKSCGFPWRPNVSVVLGACIGTDAPRGCRASSARLRK